jgi:hypothetical protein
MPHTKYSISDLVRTVLLLFGVLGASFYLGTAAAMFVVVFFSWLKVAWFPSDDEETSWLNRQPMLRFLFFRMWAPIAACLLLFLAAKQNAPASALMWFDYIERQSQFAVASILPIDPFARIARRYGLGAKLDQAVFVFAATFLFTIAIAVMTVMMSWVRDRGLEAGDEWRLVVAGMTRIKCWLLLGLFGPLSWLVFSGNIAYLFVWSVSMDARGTIVDASIESGALTIPLAIGT